MCLGEGGHATICGTNLVEPRTRPQQTQSRRLATASRKARIAVKNPQKRAAYQKRAKKLGKPLMAVATADFM